MELASYFRSIVEQDRCQVVVCDMDHTIIYMNPAAKERYADQGGAGLVGQSILVCHGPASGEQIKRVVSWFQESRSHNMIHTFRNEEENKDVYMVALRDEAGTLIGYYEKHEYRNAETARLYDFDTFS